MALVAVGKENNTDISLYYEDHGTGRPVVLIHGWPLSGASWERQTAALVAAGHRVITYDRRGFGRSSQPTEGYDYDTLARDTWHLLEALNLRDVTLVGFSMGGGEVARYLGKYNEAGRVSRAVFISSVTPALRHAGDNQEGVDPAVFEGIKQQIEADRYDFLQGFLKNFFNQKLIGGTHISDAALEAFFHVAASSSAYAMLNCVDAWLEDFRTDLAQVRLPTLVIQGDADQVLPLEATGKRTAAMIPGARLHVIPDGPHGVLWTHATEVNLALLEFLR